MEELERNLDEKYYQVHPLLQAIGNMVKDPKIRKELDPKLLEALEIVGEDKQE